MTQIILLRHGQTTWNRENRFRGQANPPLDETGLAQAEATGRYVAARWPLRAVYTSPMGRAQQTAEAVARHQGLITQVLVGIADIHFGEFQGLLSREAQARYPDLYQAWHTVPHTVQFPGGESLERLRQRAMAAVHQAIVRHTGERIGLVAHTVVNRVILCGALEIGLEHFGQWAQDTCAVNLLEWDGRRFVLGLVNDTNHLAEWGGERG